MRPFGDLRVDEVPGSILGQDLLTTYIPVPAFDFRLSTFDTKLNAYCGSYMNQNKKQKRLPNFFSTSHSHGKVKHIEISEKQKNNEKRTKKRRIGQNPMFGSLARQSGFMECPICHRSYPIRKIQAHASECDKTDETKDTFNEDDSSAERCGIPKHCIINNNELSLPSKEKINVELGTHVQNLSQAKNKWKELFSVSKPPAVVIPLEGFIEPNNEPIPGLFLFENFITDSEEDIIIRELDGSKTYGKNHDFIKWKKTKFNGMFEGKRWGVHCNLRDRRVYKEENPLPSFIQYILLPKLRRLKCMNGCIPNEANAINYQKRRGDHLKSHVDDRQLSKEPIANLSLAG